MKMNNCRYLLVCVVSLSILFFALPGYADNGTLQVKCLEPSGNSQPERQSCGF